MGDYVPLLLPLLGEPRQLLILVKQRTPPNPCREKHALFILGNLGGVLFVILSTLIFLKLYSPLGLSPEGRLVRHNPSGSTDSVKKYACSPRGEIILDMDSLISPVGDLQRKTLLFTVRGTMVSVKISDCSPLGAWDCYLAYAVHQSAASAIF